MTEGVTRHPHGTVNCYHVDRCRCEMCREAWRAYMRAYFQDRRRRGLCQNCGVPTEGRARCPRHEAQARGWSQTYRLKVKLKGAAA